MKIQPLIVLLLLAMPGLAAAQTSTSAGHGYVFFAPGGATGRGFTTSTLNLGGGGEAFVAENFAVGSEIGALWPTENFGAALGLFSVNGAYHFGRSAEGRKAVPFVTGGYSLLFREETSNLYNLGAGVDYWFREKLGLRLEFRDHIWNPGTTVHLWQVRIGMTFR